MDKNVSRRVAVMVWIGAAAAALVACGNRDDGAARPAAPAGPPPAEVGVITATPRSVGLITELPGRLDPVRVAQVRARATGILQKRVFREGSDVKAGQVLFQIDPAPYRAALDSAQASLARAQANLTQAAAQAERFKPLVEAQAVSKQDYIAAVSAQKQAEADVAAGKAAVETARINLDYTTVTSPLTGRIGRALVTEGALVSATEATSLAVVQQIDPMYVNFTQSTAELLKLRRAAAAGRVERASGAQAATVRLMLEDGTPYPAAGKLLFSDLTVDPATGQVTLRAEVPNHDGVLLPGMYVRVRIEQARVDNAIAVPQQAVTRSAQGDTLMVVSADGKVSPRQVKIAAAQDNQWVVLEGLKPGEQVMVDGFQKLRGPGPVKPVPWQAAASASAPASAASR